MLEKWNSGELVPLFSAQLIEDHKRQTKAEMERKCELHEARIAELEQNLLKVYSSRHWRLFDRYWRLRLSILNLFPGRKALLPMLLFAIGGKPLAGTFFFLLSLIGVNG